MQQSLIFRLKNLTKKHILIYMLFWYNIYGDIVDKELELIYVMTLIDKKDQKEIYVFVDKKSNKKYLSKSKEKYLKYDDEKLLYFLNNNGCILKD